MVSTICREALNESLGATLWQKELITLIVEIKQLVNNRPLTDVADFDEERPLTPEMRMGEIWSERPIIVDERNGQMKNS